MSNGRILVTGGNGRLGATVLNQLGHRGVAATRRRDHDRSAIFIGSDGTANPLDLQGIDAIINCAGQVHAAPKVIDQANITYPTRLAYIAREAGVRRFVQVSSFSVFGRAEFLDADTPLAPENDYGRSKAKAEEALLAAEAPGFAVLPLRLPFMFSADHPALLGKLTSIIRKTRVLPSPRGAPSRRSMITYAGAADALIARALNLETRAGILAAADPLPLALTDIASAIAQRLGRRILVLPVPGSATALANRVAPAMASRLFRSSILAASANMLHSSGPHSVEGELHKYLSSLRKAARLDNRP